MRLDAIRHLKSLIEHHPMMTLFALTVGLRLIVWAGAVSPAPLIPQTDPVEYQAIAESLVFNHRFFVSENEMPGPSVFSPLQRLILNHLRTPLYPLFMALIYLLVGVHPEFVAVAQSLLAGVTSVLVFQLARSIGSKTNAIGWLAGLLYAISPLNILFSNQLYSESLFETLFLVSFCFLYRFLITPSNKTLFVSAFVGSLAILTRPLGLYFPFLVCSFMMAYAFSRRWLRKVIILSVLSFLFMVIVVLLPWIARNCFLYDECFLSSSSDYNIGIFGAEMMLFSGEQVAQHPSTALTNTFLVQAMSEIESDEFDYHRDLLVTKRIGQLGREYILANWSLAVRTYVRNLLTLVVPYKYFGTVSVVTEGSSDVQPLAGLFFRAFLKGEISQVLGLLRERLAGGSTLTLLLWTSTYLFNGLLLILSLRATILLGKIRSWWVLSFLWLPIAYLYLVGGMIGGVRFLVPIIPFFCVLCGFNRIPWDTSTESLSLDGAS